MIHIYKRGNLITQCYYFDNQIDNRFLKIDNWLEWLWAKKKLHAKHQQEPRIDHSWSPVQERELSMGFKFWELPHYSSLPSANK
jgi:hypothetical protein